MEGTSQHNIAEEIEQLARKRFGSDTTVTFQVSYCCVSHTTAMVTLCFSAIGHLEDPWGVCPGREGHPVTWSLTAEYRTCSSSSIYVQYNMESSVSCCRHTV